MKKSKNLLIIWCVVLGIANICCMIYSMVYVKNYGYPPTDILGGFHIFVTAAAVIFFYPLLFLIHRYAKQEGNIAIRIITRILIIMLSIWMVMNALLILCDLFGWDGYSVQLHHWSGIANDFYNYSPVSRTLHQIIHAVK